MHNLIYASGFLYNPKTDQILLQQHTNTTPLHWSLFTTEGPSTTPAEKLFQAMMQKVLKVKIDQKKIFPVFEYTDNGEEHTVLYAELPKLEEFSAKKDVQFGWFSRKQVTKLPLSPRTKQNIIVSMRVIDASIRKSLGQHTLE